MKLCYVETDASAFTSHRRHLLRAAFDAGHEVHLIAPGSGTRVRLPHPGAVHHDLPLERGGLNPRAEAGALAELYRLYRRIRPDVVHHIALKSVLYGTLAAKAARVPAIVGSITGLGYVFMPAGRRRRLLSTVVLAGLRAALAGSQVHTILQNPDDRAFFVGQRVLRQERTSIIYGSGVDLQEFSPVPEPAGEPVVLVGTRMLWDKGIGELVEAARRLRASGVSCRFVLAGAPDPANPASIGEQQLRAWAGEGLIEWLGPSQEISRLLREATLACLPSYREGLPLFLAEAAAAGRASITADVPGCRSAVEHGETGLLVPARDAGALAEALERLLLDAALRQRMAERARRLAVERFSKEAVTQQTFAVYDAMR
jgi:glycosyltransferase involved in cell wall biosynthesis